MPNGQIARSRAGRVEAGVAIEQTLLECNYLTRDIVQTAAQRRLRNKQELFDVNERMKVVRDALH